jgi:hypothetical protein
MFAIGAIAERPLSSDGPGHADGRSWWLAASHWSHPEWVIGVPPNKIFYLAQALRKWCRISPTRMIYEAEACKPECLNLRPLLCVAPSRNLEGASHPSEVATTFEALGGGLLGSLPRFAT